MDSAGLLLYNWAGAFVFLAWALFFVAVVAYGVFEFSMAFGNAYGDGDVWPIHATIERSLLIATMLGLCVATFASATPHRALASIAVMGFWAALAVGSVISIALTSKYPQEVFARSVGRQKFSMPRRYKIRNEESGGGFAFIVCVDPFDEQDRSLRHESAYVSVKPLSEGLDYFIDIKSWHDNRHKMKQLEPMFGHDQFMFTWPLDCDPSKTASNFYLVRYDGGRLARLVRCYGKSAKSKCTQYVFSEEHLLMIDSKMWALEHWLDVEKNIKALIARWRAPTHKYSLLHAD